MSEQRPRNLPWLDQLTIHIPGYGGYFERSKRREADRALRDAIAHRLDRVRDRLNQAIRECVNRESSGPTAERMRLEQEGTLAPTEISAVERERGHILTEINTLERILQHVERVASRLKAAGSGTDAFYTAEGVTDEKLDRLHAFDLKLFRRAEALVQEFDAPDYHHNFLANVEEALNQFEQDLDERVGLLQGIR